MARWNMAPNVYWFVTLNIPSAAIDMWTSIGSTSGAERAVGLPARDHRAERVDDGPVDGAQRRDRFMCRPLAWFSATTSRTKYSCST